MPSFEKSGGSRLFATSGVLTMSGDLNREPPIPGAHTPTGAKGIHHLPIKGAWGGFKQTGWRAQNCTEGGNSELKYRCFGASDQQLIKKPSPCPLVARTQNAGVPDNENHPLWQRKPPRAPTNLTLQPSIIRIDMKTSQ